ncbi:MAG: serine/threonine protein kinase [Burkholderiales bacterium]|nr:serine/threonine protein kinase [Burkholderiales bacterium]
MDLFGKIELVRLADGSLAVSRNYRASRRWVRPLAYYLAAREKRILNILEPLNEPRLPRVLHWGDGVLVRSYIDGASLFERKVMDAEFFRNARILLDKIHACGVAHNDIEKPANWLLIGDNEAGIIDFQIAFFSRRKGPLFRVAVREDIRHLIKQKSRHCPECLSEEEEKLLAQRSFVARLWRATVKPVYNFITRKLLKYSDRKRSIHTR